MATKLEWGGEIFLILVLLVSLGANGLAVIVLAVRPSLRTISNRFVMNLLAGNLCSCCFLGAPLLLSRMMEAETAAAALPCAFAEGCTVLCTLIASLAVLLVAGDQFMAVTDPLHYHTRVSHIRSTLVIVGQWFIAAVFAVAVAFTPASKHSAWKFCVQPPEDDQTLNIYQTISGSLVLAVVVLSILGTCWMYLRITLAANRSAKPPAPPPPLLSLKTEEETAGLLMNCDKKSVGSDSSADTQQPPPKPHKKPLPYSPALARSLRSVLLEVSRPFPEPLCLKLTHETERRALAEDIFNVDRKGMSHDNIFKIGRDLPAPVMKTVRSSPNFGSSDCPAPPPPPRCSSSYMTSLRCRISNASLFRYREESRAARISSLVIVLVISSLLPPALLQVFPAMGIIPVIALFVGSAVSPFIFAYRSSRIKEELCRMCCRRSSEDSPIPQPLRRASSLSTERSWKTLNSPAWRLLRAFAAEKESSGTVPDLLTCPPGKSILKRVRAQSKMWGRKSQRCKFYQDAMPSSDAVIRRNSLDSFPSRSRLETTVIDLDDDGCKSSDEVR